MFPWNGYDTGAVDAATSVMPTFTWSAVTGATSYQIELSVSCAVASSCDLGDPTLLGSASAYTPAMPLAAQHSEPVGNRWFWRVGACNDVDCTWSDVRYLNVGRLASDFDGDGRSDLEIGTSASELWQFRDGAGSGTIVDNYGSGFGLAVSTGDFNGDGYGDLAVYADGTQKQGAIIFIPGGNPVPVVIAGSTPGAQYGLTSLSPGDLDGDGFDDLVVITDKNVSVLPGGPTGFGSASSLMAMGDMVYANGFSGVGDVDGDGYPDFAVASAGGPVTLFYGPLSSNRSAQIPPPNDESPWGVAITGGDIDGDGFSDVIISANTAAGNGIIYAFHGGPGGVSTVPQQLFATTTSGPAFGQALLYRREGTSFAIAIGDRTQAWVSYDLAPPSEIPNQQTGSTTFGTPLGGGDFAGSGHDSLVIGGTGDESASHGQSCGAVYMFDVDATGALSGHQLDAPDCLANEQFGVAISH
jgi:hypothetical protein